MRPNQPTRDPLARDPRWGRSRAELREPILAELFSVERLEDHARTLADAQKVSAAARRGKSIRPRIAENGRVLVESYRLLASAIQDERSITPAAEWLVDNFPIVDEQLREIRDDLPPDYYKELPKLIEGHLAGYPRVIGMAWAYIAHTDSRFDPDSLRRMVRAYQAVAPLTIGELWATAISLRILLVENLRRLADQIVGRRAAHEMADELADGLLALGPDSAEIAARAFRRLSRSSLPTAASVQLFQRLRDLDPAVTPALRWLEEYLASQGTTAEELVRLEHQRQATMNVTVRNVITSMRLISWFDWAEFVESVSLVDEALHERSAFGEMDFATRNSYRKAVEELARARTCPRWKLPQRRPRWPPPRRDRATETNRLSLLDSKIPATTSSRTAGWRSSVLCMCASRSSPGYDGPTCASPRSVTSAPLPSSPGCWFSCLSSCRDHTVHMARASLRSRCSRSRRHPILLSTSSIEWSPRFSARSCCRGWTSTMAFPRICGPLVAVPMLLTNESEVEDLVNSLEVHYLANREGDVRFALLSDWLDADTEEVPGDDDLLGAAAAAIDQLNERHGEAPGGGDRFLLLHRTRRWNEAEGRWMGWERKRGKLEELNAVFRGSTTTSFMTTERSESTPPTDVRYVITLDADTKLPRGAVGRLVGTIAHPLNQPNFDDVTGRVTEGYGILQPRITPTLPAEQGGSIFQRIFAGSAGIDPYSSAVSDVYQDLFQEGSFTGKGIYDVDAFDAAMHRPCAREHAVEP